MNYNPLVRDAKQVQPPHGQRVLLFIGGVNDWMFGKVINGEYIVPNSLLEQPEVLYWAPLPPTDLGVIASLSSTTL